MESTERCLDAGNKTREVVGVKRNDDERWRRSFPWWWTVNRNCGEQRHGQALAQKCGTRVWCERGWQ
jgi:hypothetical protein